MRMVDAEYFFCLIFPTGERKYLSVLFYVLKFDNKKNKTKKMIDSVESFSLDIDLQEQTKHCLEVVGVKLKDRYAFRTELLFQRIY